MGRRWSRWLIPVLLGAACGRGQDTKATGCQGAAVVRQAGDTEFIALLNPVRVGVCSAETYVFTTSTIAACSDGLMSATEIVMLAGVECAANTES